MIKIELSNASNGVIKKVIDTHSNQDTIENLKVYEIEPEDKPDSFLGIIELLEDVSSDLGLDLGSDFESTQIKMYFDWGEKYQPSLEEVDDRIKGLSAQIKHLKEVKKVLIENANNV